MPVRAAQADVPVVNLPQIPLASAPARLVPLVYKYKAEHAKTRRATRPRPFPPSLLVAKTVQLGVRVAHSIQLPPLLAHVRLVAKEIIEHFWVVLAIAIQDNKMME